MLVLFSVLLLSYTMESAGMLTLITVPLLIGLLPMPADALVSAMMLSGICEGAGHSAGKSHLRQLLVPPPLDTRLASLPGVHCGFPVEGIKAG